MKFTPECFKTLVLVCLSLYKTRLVRISLYKILLLGAFSGFNSWVSA